MLATRSLVTERGSQKMTQSTDADQLLTPQNDSRPMKDPGTPKMEFAVPMLPEDESPLPPSTALNPNKLRERRLTDLAEKPLSLDNMRQLFRLLDMDGSQEVSPGEIQRGLVLLGFEAANDPAALARLLLDIDEDKTGTITEAEFLAFFSGNITRKSLQERLESYVISRACIKATFFGNRNGKPFVETQDVDPKDLSEVFSRLSSYKKNGAQQVKLWLDVVGFDDGVHSELARLIGISSDEMREAMLVQEPTVSVIQGNWGPRAMVICHTQSASCSPLRRKSRGIVDFLPYPLSAMYTVITGAVPKDTEVEIVPNKIITRNQPSISLEQASLLVVDDTTLITLRVPNFKAGYDSSRFRTATSSLDQDPLMNDGSILNDAYSEVREQMREVSPYVEHIFDGTVKSLAVTLVDTILTKNNMLYDDMQDWLEAILHDVKQGVSSRQTTHISSFLSMRQGLCSNIEILEKALNPDAWSNDSADNTQDKSDNNSPRSSGSGASGHGKHPQGRASVSDDKNHGTGSWNSNSFAKARLSRTHSCIGVVAQSSDLRIVFDRQLPEFYEMSSNLKSIVANMESKRLRVEESIRLIEAKKSDMMNTTLYALTLITTLTIPMGFLTGLFGMNFDDMYELYPSGTSAEAIGKPNYVEPPVPIVGYKLFWTVLGIVEGLIILFMLRFRLFDALW
jgi:hypothetical protein